MGNSGGCRIFPKMVISGNLNFYLKFVLKRSTTFWKKTPYTTPLQPLSVPGVRIPELRNLSTQACTIELVEKTRLMGNYQSTRRVGFPVVFAVAKAKIANTGFSETLGNFSGYSKKLYGV